MLVVLSPAKSLDTETPVRTRKHSQPDFIADAKSLIKTLRKLSPEELANLMNISSNLATINHERYANWHEPFDNTNARPAIYTFMGDVYQGLAADSFSSSDMSFAQKHLRILSGLYGVLKPLDLMQPYRLEMGTPLTTQKGCNLYNFWGQKLTRSLNEDLLEEKKKIVVNLASNEYFKAVQPGNLEAKIITPAFKDFSSGKYRFLSFYAKQARGMMAAFIIKNRLTNVAKLKDFDTAGYKYSAEDSSETSPVFLRKLAS